jgi:tetratricopeptide (TPR) repeat protein
VQETVFSPANDIPPGPAPKKKTKLILIISIVAAVLIIAGAIVGFLVWQEQQRSDAYDSAVAAEASGDYQTALDGFTELGDYQDSAAHAANNAAYLEAIGLFESEDYEAAQAAFTELAPFGDSQSMLALCEQWLAFLAAQDQFEGGDVDGALTIFEELANQGFSEALEWQNKANYSLAESSLSEGHNYAAYERFSQLGDYEDAADRAEACKVSMPSTGIIWQDSAWFSVASSIVLEAGNMQESGFYKLYAGGSCIATVFLNPGGSVEVEVPAGTYEIKEATGSQWWGDTDIFGPNGFYSQMTFEGDVTTFEVAYNRIITITMRVGSGGNVGSESESWEDF